MMMTRVPHSRGHLLEKTSSGGRGSWNEEKIRASELVGSELLLRCLTPLVEVGQVLNLNAADDFTNSSRGLDYNVRLPATVWPNLQHPVHTLPRFNALCPPPRHLHRSIVPCLSSATEQREISAMEPSEVTSQSDSLLPNEPCVASMSTPPRSVGKNKSGHILNSDSHNMIFHCYTYWRNREPERSVEDTSKFVAEMLGVSESTVFKVRREAKASSSSGGNLSTPSRKRPRNAKRRRSTKYDSFTLCALRSCVHDFFRRNEIPTVEKITNEFSNRMDLPSLKRCTTKRSAASPMLGAVFLRRIMAQNKHTQYKWCIDED
ncbi:hypothetical protein HPB52_001701 [Rhipicephalus sanguineus]|uniref:Uncharacterized protein n=1 Tax=Rhipicephalus sanguineus TaxID=34632 RepID=A0A9D4SMQ6_RHISA|nr:hypothetical protein HPB52_001701 [Rhipicephalus sanguineus]